MTEPITVPVSAPGATSAGKELDAAAAAAERLALAQKRVALEAQVQAVKTRQAAEAEHKFAAEVKKSTEQLNAQQTALSKNGEALRKAKAEARQYSESSGGGHGGNSKALYMASRAFPGHEMQILNGASMLKGAGAGAGVGIGAAAAGIMAFAAYMRVAGEIAADHNKIAQEGLKIDQEMHVAKRNAKWELEANAANTAKGQRKSKQFILNSELDGESLLGRIRETGTGTEGLTSMARMIKDKRRFGGMTGSGILAEAQDVSQRLGLDLNDVMSEMANGQGHYNRARTERELIGRGNSRELYDMAKNRGAGSTTGELLQWEGGMERNTNRFNDRNASDADTVVAGMTRQYENLTNPMKEIISEHNRKIDEQIEMQKKILEREVAGWESIHEWLASMDKTGYLAGGKSQEATREARTLRAGKR